MDQYEDGPLDDPLIIPVTTDPIPWRAALIDMLSQMQDEMEEIRDRELAQLPLQPHSSPLCPHCVEKDLKRVRN